MNAAPKVAVIPAARPDSGNGNVRFDCSGFATYL